MNESMIIIIEGVSDHSADMKRNGKGGEMDVMGYQTKNFHICPGATTAFTNLVNRGFRGEQGDMLAQIAMLVDDFLGIEVMAMQQGGVNMAETRKMIDMGNATFFHLGVFAMSIQDESIVSLFNFMPDHILKVVEVSTEEIMDHDDEGCDCH
tara:strand:- start:18 stop:473 length:456 start_codon:yes stop_codon:yes gene_type:complete